MKKIIMILMIAIGVSSVTFGQTKMSNDSKVEAQVIALEKASWEEWKNKNSVWFQTNLTEEFLGVHDFGVDGKAAVVKSIAADCDVKSFSLDNLKFVMLTKDSALLNYAAAQDAVCSGQPMPERVRVAAVYVRRGDKWMQALYTEVEAVQENGSVETQIIALEKAAWEAWKNKDTAWFQKNDTDEIMFVNSDGVRNKSQYIKDIPNCDVKSFSLDNFKLEMLDKNAALLTYTAAWDATCGGQKNSAQVRAAVNYVNRSGKWMGAFYTETPMTK